MANGVMSECSENYHLRAAKQQSGTDLLQAAGVNGFVYPQTNGWVTVLAEGEPFELNSRLLHANQGGLLYYWCAEDYGWGFVACWDARVISRYEHTWDEDVRLDDAELDPPALRDWLRSVGVGADPSQSFQEIFDPDEADGFSVTPAHCFAALVGLNTYKWLSYDNVANEFDEDDPSFRGVVAVRRNESVSTSSEACAATDVPPVQGDVGLLIPTLFYGDASTTRKAWKKIASVGWKAGEWGGTLAALEMTPVDALPGGITLSVAWGIPAARESLWRPCLVPEVLKDLAINEKRLDKLDAMDRLDHLMLTGMDNFWFTLGLLQYGRGSMTLSWPRRMPEREVFAEFFARFVHWLPELEAIAPRITDRTGIHAYDRLWPCEILVTARYAGYDVRPLANESGPPQDLTSALLRAGIIEAAGGRFRIKSRS